MVLPTTAMLPTKYLQAFLTALVKTEQTTARLNTANSDFTVTNYIATWVIAPIRA